MYGHHYYNIKLEITQTKRDQEIKTTYNASCTLGGYHTLANVLDFAKKSKSIYQKATHALQKGCFIRFSVDYSVYRPTTEEEYAIGKQLNFRRWYFNGYCHDLGYDIGDKIDGIMLSLDTTYDKGDMEFFYY